MKWLVLLFLFVLTSMYSCTSVSAKPQSSVRKVETFRPFPTIGAAPSVVSVMPLPSPTIPSTPKPKSTTHASSQQDTGGKKNAGKVIRGEASWGYGFYGHVVTRYPRGTRIRVCGRLGCTDIVRSWGYGPAKKTGRIADLDVHVFEDVCGPRSMGVCQIKLEVFK